MKKQNTQAILITIGVMLCIFITYGVFIALAASGSNAYVEQARAEVQEVIPDAQFPSFGGFSVSGNTNGETTVTIQFTTEKSKDQMQKIVDSGKLDGTLAYYDDGKYEYTVVYKD